MKEVTLNTLESWLICYETLNDIIFNPKNNKLNNSLALGILEPMSRVVTRMVVKDDT